MTIDHVPTLVSETFEGIFGAKFLKIGQKLTVIWPSKVFI